MDPRYDIKEVESRIYKQWEDSGFFNPDVCIEKGVTPADAEAFSLVLPPPNVTGTLHIGHAFEDSLQDAVIRYERMKGKRTLWVPGTDHAAIATQSKVEKELAKEEHTDAEGKTRKMTRYDLGREEFLKRVETFAQESHDTIVRQIKRLGASLDWSREAYTLDAARSLAVRTAFKKMYDLGLIYRGNRIVNWDPNMQTTVSDDEVEWADQTTPFYYLKYGPFTIGTARPETKFGDKYVVMHPDDKRYVEYKEGQKIELEWINGPITATIIKDTAIDMEFGTGVMTITPWHDMVDFEIAQRHGLDMEQIIDIHGKLLPIAGEFAGTHIKKARPLIIEKLQGKGLVEKIDEKYANRIATNSRGNGVIEPQILKQWFVDVNKKIANPNGGDGDTEVTLKELMRNAVQNGQIKIVPERFEKIYFNWIENLRDWCISRQIWFGHRIPVWYRGAPGTWNLKIYGEDIFENIGNGRKRFETRAGKPDGEKENAAHMKAGESITFTAVKPGTEESLGLPPLTKEIVKTQHFDSIEAMLKEIPLSEIAPGLTEAQYKEKMHSFPRYGERIEKYGVWAIELKNPEQEIYVGIEAPAGDGWTQDSDTLDTWFSSGLWPFSTLGWPDTNAADFKTYFPNSFMAPGYEILFFWVARMVLMSGVLTCQVPFSTVYIHGIVRDSKGEKFSKSKGNGIDPVVLADQYGADALRMALIVGAAPGNDVKFDEQRVKGYRNFATKIWNIARFIKLSGEALGEAANGGNETNAADIAKLTETANDTHKQYLTELTALKSEITAHLDAYEFHLASEKIYHYIWHTLADKIIEAEKPALRDGDDAAKAASYAVLETLLLESLKMLHPFMPYITEAIFQIFKPGKVLMVERW